MLLLLPLPEYTPWDFACSGASYFVTQSKVVLRNAHYEDMVREKKIFSPGTNTRTTFTLWKSNIGYEKEL
jgi:hypothetical protein